MRTALDTNILSAVWAREPGSETVALQVHRAKMDGQLLISGVVYSELLANPRTTESFVNRFLEETGIDVHVRMSRDGWAEAGRRFGQYSQRRRRSGGGEPRRLLADFIVGAHALLEADRLMTLDPGRYQQDFPELRLLDLAAAP